MSFLLPHDLDDLYVANYQSKCMTVTTNIHLTLINVPLMRTVHRVLDTDWPFSYMSMQWHTPLQEPV